MIKNKKNLIIAGGLAVAIIFLALTVVSQQAKAPVTGSTAVPTPTSDAAKSVTTLIDALPYSTNNYNIDYVANDDGSVDIMVGLRTQYDETTDPAARTAQLRERKQAALDYIAKYGGDTSKLSIIVDPDPDDTSE
jgi:hypothetical protein